MAPVVGSTVAYADIESYFADYPPRSYMSDHSRAVLYSLARMLKPEAVAEIGTLFAGTTEVLARALWENGRGLVYTTDPFGGERCPGIIATWPRPLQDVTRFHALNSMDFLRDLDQRGIVLDLVLIDGNHEYEFALFDLQMAAKLLRPGGVIVMDNAEQTGPFKAARTFLELNPAWREMGHAIASHDRARPFDATRTSVAGTSFILLQSPAYLPVGEDIRSWGEVRAKSSHFDGFTLELPGQTTAGTLHYQAILRAFPEGGGALSELKTIGSVRLDMDGPTTITHRFKAPMRCADAARYTTEIDLAWQPDPGAPALALAGMPTPL